MVGIELLRALAAHLDREAEVAGLGARLLRFVIEYAAEVDVATTRAKIRQVIGIDDVQVFALFDDPSADDEFGVFYVLQFPGFERTMDNGSLFSIAHELQTQLGAVTVEPDIGSEFYQEPVPPGAVDESVVKDQFHGTSSMNACSASASVVTSRGAEHVGASTSRISSGVTRRSTTPGKARALTRGFRMRFGSDCDTDATARRGRTSRSRRNDAGPGVR